MLPHKQTCWLILQTNTCKCTRAEHTEHDPPPISEPSDTLSPLVLLSHCGRKPAALCTPTGRNWFVCRQSIFNTEHRRFNLLCTLGRRHKGGRDNLYLVGQRGDVAKRQRDWGGEAVAGFRLLLLWRHLNIHTKCCSSAISDACSSWHKTLAAGTLIHCCIFHTNASTATLAEFTLIL